MTARRVVVTRPAREAERWAAELRARSIDAVALPLIAVAPVDDARTLDAARQRARHVDALMFVSAAAVAHFFATPGTVIGAGTRCWSTGPGTTAALLAAGVRPEAIDMPPADAAQFDSEHLWPLVRRQAAAGRRVLMVRGGDAQGQPSGRAWLAREIEAAGAELDVVVAYQRSRPAWDAAQYALARSAAQGIWLLTSSEAVHHLGELLPDVLWRGASAVATHPRIARAAVLAGFGTVHSSQPGLAGLISSIESIA